MKFEFGQVVSQDYEPAMRLMILCRTEWGPNPTREIWSAVVLADITWPVGLIVTVAPTNSGLMLLGNALED